MRLTVRTRDAPSFLTAEDDFYRVFNLGFGTRDAPFSLPKRAWNKHSSSQQIVVVVWIGWDSIDTQKANSNDEGEEERQDIEGLSVANKKSTESPLWMGQILHPHCPFDALVKPHKE